MSTTTPIPIPNNEEAEQFFERAAKAIYLQGELLAMFGLNPDNPRPTTEILERVRALRASEKKGCPHVVAGSEGTSYCNLAESSVLALRKQLGEAQELHNMQLAAIMTATLQNTETSKKDRIGRDNPYCTVAYLDVCTSVDREMKLIERVRVLENLLQDFVSNDSTPRPNCSCHISPPCNDCVNYAQQRELVAQASRALKATEDAT